MSNEYGELFQSYVRSGRYDSKNREIGYIIGLRDNGVDFRAYVQNARRVNGEWFEFGPSQRSKSFTSQALAVRWANVTAQERISKLKA